MLSQGLVNVATEAGGSEAIHRNVISHCWWFWLPRYDMMGAQRLRACSHSGQPGRVVGCSAFRLLLSSLHLATHTGHGVPLGRRHTPGHNVGRSRRPARPLFTRPGSPHGRCHPRRPQCSFSCRFTLRKDRLNGPRGRKPLQDPCKRQRCKRKRVRGKMLQGYQAGLGRFPEASPAPPIRAGCKDLPPHEKETRISGRYCSVRPTSFSSPHF